MTTGYATKPSTLSVTVNRDGYQSFVQRLLRLCPGAECEIVWKQGDNYGLQVQTDVAGVERLLERDRLMRSIARN